MFYWTPYTCCCSNSQPIVIEYTWLPNEDYIIQCNLMCHRFPLHDLCVLPVLIYYVIICDYILCSQSRSIFIYLLLYLFIVIFKINLTFVLYVCVYPCLYQQTIKYSYHYFGWPNVPVSSALIWSSHHKYYLCIAFCILLYSCYNYICGE